MASPIWSGALGGTCGLFLLASAQAATLANYTFETGPVGNVNSSVFTSSIDTDDSSVASDFVAAPGLRGTTITSGNTSSVITGLSQTGAPSPNSQHLVIRTGGTGSTDQTDRAGAVMAEDYYSFSITPAPGQILSLTSLSFDARMNNNSSVTGRIYITSSLDYNADLFVWNQVGSTSTTLQPQSFTLPAAFQSISSEVTFRFIFADNSGTPSTSSAEVFRLDNIKVEGVPEPGSATLVALGSVGLLRRSRRGVSLVRG
jgi:hypothetical protein